MSRVTKLALGTAAILMLGAPAAVSPAVSADVTFGYIIGGPAPPPPPRIVVRPAMPRAGLIWREGHFGWRDGAYVWLDGEWLEPPYKTATWVPGHWLFRDGRNIYIEGHWEG